MLKRVLTSLWLAMSLFLTACSRPPATSVPQLAATLPVTLQTPVLDISRHSDGGGEPRSIGYWLVWNSCAEGNQASVAAANGGRDAGWIIVDDLLQHPGVLMGELSVDSCQQAVNLLQRLDLQGFEHPDDPAYALAAQLLAAQLNLAAGSEYCPAVDQAVKAGQLLLLSLGFDGSASYLEPPIANQGVVTAGLLTDQLSQYNAGTLCR